MQVFLNELSLPQVATRSEVILAFDNFVNCYKLIRRYGVSDIKIQSNFFNYEFAPNYTFFNWIEDPAVDDDAITLLKGVFGSVPYCENIYDNENIINMICNGYSCVGLGLASEYFYNTLSISYANSSWQLSNYTVDITVLGEANGSTDLLEELASSNVFNVSNTANIAENKTFIKNHATQNIQNGTELWRVRSRMFPNLEFCNSVCNQIAQFNVANGLSGMIERLFDLQRVAASISGKSIEESDFGFYTTQDSDTRLRDFRNVLNVVCPDGTERLFSWHNRFTPGAGRIYFFPLEAEQKFIIGVIGNQNLLK